MSESVIDQAGLVQTDPRLGPTESASSRVPELDGLRGLAAGVVLLFHANGRWIPWGWAAVDLFFVLSGYLVTSIVLRHQGSLRFLISFYARRGLRVWPLYYLVVGFVAATIPWIPSKADWSGFPYILTFTLNFPAYWGSSAPAINRSLGHVWTLAIEEQFYLVWPALLLLVGRGRVIPLALACGGASVAARWSGWNYTLLIARADGMALGAILAGLLSVAGAGMPRIRRLRIAMRTSFLTGATAVALLGGFVRLGELTNPGPTLLAYNAMFFGLVGIAAINTGKASLAVLRMPWLLWLGKVSYGLYLIHHILFVALIEAARAYGLPGRPLWLLLPAIAASLVLAELAYRFIEAPILRWKDRFPYPDSRVPRELSKEGDDPACASNLGNLRSHGPAAGASGPTRSRGISPAGLAEPDRERTRRA